MFDVGTIVLLFLVLSIVLMFGFVLGRFTPIFAQASAAGPGVEFENIANNVLTRVSGQLMDLSKRDIAAVLEPLRDRINDFQKKVEETHVAESREIGILRSEIEKVVNASATLSGQADGLPR